MKLIKTGENTFSYGKTQLIAVSTASCKWCESCDLRKQCNKSKTLSKQCEKLVGCLSLRKIRK